MVSFLVVLGASLVLQQSIAMEISCIEQMQEIKREYPNFYNADMPAMVYCTPMENWNVKQHEHHLKQAFTRICSQYFCVVNVKIHKSVTNSRCQAKVKYGLITGKDLPEEPDLKILVSFLLKHCPLNTFILRDQRLLELPKYVIIPYEIFCDCTRKFFDKAA